jgi:TolB-like protein/class 3 adenylate cyclase/Flp pilus assembly protein TadD
VAADRVERKLAAILAADMVGYSRLMEADEEGTIARQKVHRAELVDPEIAAHGGRIVKTTGDGMLVEFASVVDAVKCAIAVQQSLAESEVNVPEDQRIHYRVGINLGDIVIDGDDILGDGVNVAARLEGLAEPGGVCISDVVHQSVAGKLDLAFDDLGDQQVKNIERPVRVYRVRTDAEMTGSVLATSAKRAARWKLPGVAAVLVAIIAAGGLAWWQPWAPNVEPALVQRTATSLPDKPSIAVLPFDNLSGDPEQEYFADGMAEDVITDLSKLSALFVIARNSSFQYKGQAVDAKRVGRELGVKFILEGSVRRAGDQVRINTQLIDAQTGGHLWAERYDGRLADVFALQDSVRERIVAALAVHLTAGEENRFARRDTDNVAAYDAFLQGWEHFNRRTPGDFVKAVGYLERAIELDPDYGRAHAALATIYWKSWLWSVMTMSPAIASPWTRMLDIPVVYAPDEAKKYLEVAMRNPNALGHQVASEMRLYDREFDAAVTEAERAITLNPNDSSSYIALAQALIFAGREEEAMQFVDRAARLDPHAGVNLFLSGLVRFSAPQLDQAATLFERALERSPFNREWNIPLTSAYSHLGRDQEARKALGNFGGGLLTVGSILENWPFGDPEVAELFGSGLIKAGMCCERDVQEYVARVRQEKLAR